MIRKNHTEEGSILALSLFVTMAILGVGLSVMMFASTGMKMSGNISRRQEALKAAEVGIQRAKAILSATDNWTTLLGTSGGVGCTSTAYSSAKGNIFCDGGTPLENVPLITTGSTTETKAPGMGFIKYTVYIRNDNIENQSDAGAFSEGDKQVVILAEGIGRDGLSYAGIEAVLVKTH